MGSGGGFQAGRFLLSVGLGNALDEGLGRGSAVHAAALVRTPGVVGDKVGIQGDLHLLDGLEPSPAAFDADVLVVQRAVQALDDEVGPRPGDADALVGNDFLVPEQFVGMPVPGRQGRGRWRLAPPRWLRGAGRRWAARRY